MGPLIWIHLGARPHRPHVWIKPDRQNVTSACNWITDASLEWWLLHRPPALACVTQFWLNPACQPAILPHSPPTPQYPPTCRILSGHCQRCFMSRLRIRRTKPHHATPSTPHYPLLSPHSRCEQQPDHFHVPKAISLKILLLTSIKKGKQSNKRSPPLRSIFSEECSIFNLP